jgi:hypothetical protein
MRAIHASVSSWLNPPPGTIFVTRFANYGFACPAGLDFQVAFFIRSPPNVVDLFLCFIIDEALLPHNRRCHGE